MTHPAAVLPEALLYGFFVALCAWQLSLAPRTFLNYSAATSIELMTKEWALEKALEATLLETKMQEEEDKPSKELASYRQCMADANGSSTLAANGTGKVVKEEAAG